jgi:hypothetical protein
MLNAVNRSVINPNDTSLVNLMHFSLIAWKNGDSRKLEELLSNNPIIDNSFWQFCQAVAECLPVKHEEKVLLEGLLVSKYCSH